MSNARRLELISSHSTRLVVAFCLRQIPNFTPIVANINFGTTSRVYPLVGNMAETRWLHIPGCSPELSSSEPHNGLQFEDCCTLRHDLVIGDGSPRKGNHYVYHHLLYLLVAAVLPLVIYASTPMDLLRSYDVPRSLRPSSLILPSRVEPVLDVFQVSTPITIPVSATCQGTLMEYSFANSYGKPFIGKSDLVSRWFSNIEAKIHGR